MKIFLAFSFRPDDKELVSFIDRLIASHGVQSRTEEGLGGEQVATAVQARISEHWLTPPYTETEEAIGSGRESVSGAPPGEGRRTAFVSSGAENAELERGIREVPSTRRFRVVNSDDVLPGVPIGTGVDHLMAGAEAAIFLLSGKPNLTVKMEIARAKANGVPHLVPVKVASAAEAPSELRGIQAVTINDRMNLELVADQIFGTATL